MYKVTKKQSYYSNNCFFIDVIDVIDVINARHTQTSPS